MCKHPMPLVFSASSCGNKFGAIYWCPRCGALRENDGIWQLPEPDKTHECEDFVWNAPTNMWRCIECKQPYVKGYGEHDQPELGTDTSG